MVTNSLCMCLPGFDNLRVCMHILFCFYSLFNYNVNVYNIGVAAYWAGRATALPIFSKKEAILFKN